MNGCSRFTILDRLLPSPIRLFYPISQPLQTLQQNPLAWISRYRRLNTIFERTEAHLVAFIEIAFISILSRRLVRLGTQQISA